MLRTALTRQYAPQRTKRVTNTKRTFYTVGGDETDYAFEMATSNVRYGKGVTREVGKDMVHLKCSKVAVFTDKNIAKIKDGPLSKVEQSLVDNKVNYVVYKDTKVEPTDVSFKHAIKFAQDSEVDGFIAVGGGSTIDTAKAANLYSSHPTTDFLDYVNAPIGKAKPPPGPLKPLIAIPTTAGTGSEATGIAIFDFEDMKAKTGIAHRSLKPTLGLVDVENTATQPRSVATYAGFDVLCHALESYTAIPFNARGPRPETPNVRPAYQGSNPISDVWSLYALKILQKYFYRAVEDPSDEEARAQMILAATYAGIGFGTAGVHLCHGMSYPVSSQLKSYTADGFDYPLIPHGLSVVLHAPAVFKFIEPARTDRVARAAEVLGVESTQSEKSGALSDMIVEYMQRLNVPGGLRKVGCKDDFLDNLVQGTLPQHRVTKLSPKQASPDDLHKMFVNSMDIY
mmetsp:Transcript_1437/g.1615  ORF Transcript_1437/g.1615 Transcript_1437/m.1615 type:complete len:455 (+) Transcript_1437:74-1438(+)